MHLIESQTHPQFGRYTLSAELGRGGMGVVYHAYDPELQRPLAIKVLAPTLADSGDAIARLRREAISAARLRHSNIALLYELNYEGGRPFLAMEYIPGESLRRLLEAGPLPRERALTILAQLASALEYAHGLGVVHRDVKPANVIVGPHDHATLIDFGLAEIADTPLITADSGAGTPHYLAPEQARGLSADARADQYALGAVAYEMLTGRPPFYGRPAAALVHAQIYEPPPPPDECDPTLPAAAGAVLLRALAKSPHERYPSTTAFVDALRQALAAPAAPVVSRRRRLVVALASLLVLLAAAALLIRMLQPGRPTLSAGMAWAYPTELIGSSAPVLAGDTLVVGQLDGALLGIDARSGELRWHQGGGEVALAPPVFGRGLIYTGDSDGALLALSPGSGGTVWRTPTVGAVLGPAISDGVRVIALTDKGYVYVLRSENGQVIWSRPLAPGLRAGAAAGDWIVVSAGASLFALDARSGAVVWEYVAPSAFISGPLISGDQVLAGTERGTLHVLRIPDGEEVLRIQARAPLATAPLRAEGFLYLADLSGRLSAISPDSGHELWHVDTGGAITGTPLLLDDRLIVGSGDGTLSVIDARSGRIIDQRSFGGGIVSSPIVGSGLLFIRADQLYALRLP